SPVPSPAPGRIIPGVAPQTQSNFAKRRKTMMKIIRLFSLVVMLLAFASASVQRSSPPIMPDPAKTPGDTLAVTKNDICVPGYSKKVRDVPESVKRQVYASYGIMSHRPHEYEVDHLISLELGGSNSIKNLWPQSYETQPYNAHVKDALENKLHRMVCDGTIDLKVAQREIATNWIEAYRKYVGADLPPLSGGNRSPAPGRGSGQIIGNKNSHIYHKPGCPGYDQVSEANRVTFGSEAEAERAGYRKAKNCP